MRDIAAAQVVGVLVPVRRRLRLDGFSLQRPEAQDLKDITK